MCPCSARPLGKRTRTELSPKTREIVTPESAPQEYREPQVLHSSSRPPVSGPQDAPSPNRNPHASNAAVQSAEAPSNTLPCTPRAAEPVRIQKNVAILLQKVRDDIHDHTDHCSDEPFATGSLQEILSRPPNSEKCERNRGGCYDTCRQPPTRNLIASVTLIVPSSPRPCVLGFAFAKRGRVTRTPSPAPSPPC